MGRSDIVLQVPNIQPQQAMPLGNGRLGVAVWAANGFTAQLNRADTLPNRLSPGQVEITGLKNLVNAKDYAGRVDLYNGELREHGGGMTATIYVQPDSDVMVVRVTGAAPNTLQTAIVHLWAPRLPHAVSRDGISVLSETWKDATEAGATGKTFGSLAAITAEGRNVQASVESPLTVKVSFLPYPDGSFQVLIAAPAWTGGNAVTMGQHLLEAGAKTPSSAHRLWWNNFWQHAGLMKLHSHDGSAEYIENLRLIDLYTAAAESLGRLPGSQAGIGDLFSSVGDIHKWGPSAYWHWNLRMQVAANLGAGVYSLNDSYFRLYRDNLDAIRAWTKARMNGLPGICIPETMRFNGAGYENETWIKNPGRNCDAGSPPYYNARTLSTGAEVSLWIWRQYLATKDHAFLAENYPVMADSARFLLAYAKHGTDGFLHTHPSNAHETQWDVHDPTTDISAMKSLFPAVLQAASILKTDTALAHQLQAALPEILPLPRADETDTRRLLKATDDGGHDIIAPSYEPGATMHNTENIGLEPVWPYSILGDSGSDHDLAVRTYMHRPNQLDDDWSSDPIDAARLGLAKEVQSSLIGLTEKYQAYPSGLATFVGPEFYVEQIGVLTAAVQEALVQDYDGVIRIAPAWPSDWDADGTVFIQDRSKVDVQIRQGIPRTVVIEAGFTGHIRIRNPWPGKSVEAVSGQDNHRVAITSVDRSILEFPVSQGQAYIIQRSGFPNAAHPFAPVTGIPAMSPKTLGPRSIGLLAKKNKG
ncbi:MAG TPA: glycoside hydrolase [Acidobacteriaceae bacterium]|nr:glycoside hydrolase [Acidobacteriaceae bacterium]